MVLLRSRHKKMAPPFGPGVNEEGSGVQRQAQVRARQENRRRAVLYNVSSSTGQRLPSVSLQPEDARIRRDLLRLTQQQDQRVENDKISAYENEQSDCKHREHLCYRPPLDHIQKLRDLHTTVPKDSRGRVNLTTEERMLAKMRLQSNPPQDGVQQGGVKPEWRLGYSNNVDTGSRAGVSRTFEPRDSTRERILDSRSAPVLLPSSVAVAYPVKNDIDPNDFLEVAADNQIDEKETFITRDSYQHGTKKKPWCPASSAAMMKPQSTTSPRRYRVDHFTSQSLDGTVNSSEMNSYDHDGLQRFPIRSVEQFDSIEDTQENIAMNARYTRKQQTLKTKVAGTFARVRARMDRMKDPHLRYELPIEDTGQNHPAYRLGLDPVPSTQLKQSERPRFRPRSAGTAMGFQIGQRGPKAGDMLTAESNGVAKVAGARLRPHSASITHFKNSTVYCMGPPTPSTSNCASAATDFRSVLAIESQKRQRERESVLQKLATRGLLHTIPLAQVFARLRREALHNVERQMQHSVFERMTLEEYMSACGCIHSPLPPATDKKQQHSESPGSPMKEIRRFGIDLMQSASSAGPSVDASPSLLATRKSLIVSRQQFHLALEAFNLPSLDVNLLFTALDVTVSDSVQIWDAMCAVEVLQHEHTALRRARVQQLQAPPTKDLDFFRRHNT